MTVYRQTVEIAIDTSTGELYHATRLHDISEEQFSALRRTAMEERVSRKKSATEARFICAICRKPLWLSRYNCESGNRWFNHDCASPGCPWYEGRKLSPDQLKAVIYHGQQEGPEHRRIKDFLATWLEREPRVTKVNRELVTMGQVLKGEWKRPDVQCLHGDKRIVFEIQLSYTFLSEVIKRDNFYRQEGIFIIWVFQLLDLNRAVVRDEVFFNGRNLFVVDDAAEEQTIADKRLTFSGYFQKPYVTPLTIKDSWEVSAITFDDITLPIPSYRPYFFDYAHAREQVETEQRERQKKHDREEFQNGLNEYLAAAMEYYAHDYETKFMQPVLDAVDVISKLRYIPVDLDLLRDETFFGWHGVLPVLLSIKHDRAIGYSVGTPYQVLEGALRKTIKGRKHSFTVLYLWACRIFNPTVSNKQHAWIKVLADNVKASVVGGADKYQRNTEFDEAIALLFPELREKLTTNWARG